MWKVKKKVAEEKKIFWLVAWISCSGTRTSFTSTRSTFRLLPSFRILIKYQLHAWCWCAVDPCFYLRTYPLMYAIRSEDFPSHLQLHLHAPVVGALYQQGVDLLGDHHLNNHLKSFPLRAPISQWSASPLTFLIEQFWCQLTRSERISPRLRVPSTFLWRKRKSTFQKSSETPPLCNFPQGGCRQSLCWAAVVVHVDHRLHRVLHLPFHYKHIMEIREVFK